MRGLWRLRRLSRRLKRTLAPAAVVLLYHRVADLEDDPDMIAVSPARFAEHLAVIRQTCYPMRLLELVEAVRRRAIPRRAVVLTFDDGYEEFIREVYPLLWSTEVPATVFAISGVIGDLFPTKDAAQYGPGARYRVMNAEELRSLAQSGLVEVGAHTITHPRLSSLSRERQWQEITESRRQLEALLDTPVLTFSYPHGRSHDHTDETVQLVRDAGYQAACTAVPGCVEPGTDLYTLPRHWINNWDRETFARHLDHFFLS